MIRSRFDYGDTVVVTSEMSGWYHWISKMTGYVGCSGVVIGHFREDFETSYARVKFNDGNIYFFPDSCLEYYSVFHKEEDVAPAMDLKSLFDGGFKRDG